MADDNASESKELFQRMVESKLQNWSNASDNRDSNEKEEENN